MPHILLPLLTRFKRFLGVSLIHTQTKTPGEGGLFKTSDWWTYAFPIQKLQPDYRAVITDTITSIPLVTNRYQTALQSQLLTALKLNFSS